MSQINEQILPPRINLPSLEKNVLELRALKDFFLTGLVWGLAILASIPLISVIYMLIMEGGARLDFEAITALPPAGFETGGGFGNAIVGTLTMVGIASALSIPIGTMAALYLAILNPNSKTATVSRFLSKVLTGFPSILAGVFVYAVIVITTGTYSAWAGGVALAVLMLPTVTLAAEEAMKQVPQRMKDAAFGSEAVHASSTFPVCRLRIKLNWHGLLRWHWSYSYCFSISLPVSLAEQNLENNQGNNYEYANRNR